MADPQVLCQEFLRGKEYVIDHVSRDGVHKLMMTWVYDKRPRNGSQFVYFGMLPIDPRSEEAQALVPYVRGVLDALGMRHGVSCGSSCRFCCLVDSSNTYREPVVSTGTDDVRQ